MISFLLIGWTLASRAGVSAEQGKEPSLKVATIDVSSGFELTDNLTDGFTQLFVHEALVTPTVSHQIPLPFFAIISAIGVSINGVALPLRRDVFYYFFAWFRRLFGHQIAINAP
ncbi:hypothetical protein [Larkinella humicola]|uniref:Uncharacterized protein n=1 Tax=Larkinella humicola TaxID=2607654 RepID=A0A5N1JMP2_9BACT|nr:hypothetical protein [Larkinella humicola]KAA9356707.1 hypothetical protein F0P93_02880 [Larkinella humicola]